MREHRSAVGIALTVLPIVCAALWFFPLYWAVITALKPEYEVIQPGLQLLP